jgi:hypothetical protein
MTFDCLAKAWNWKPIHNCPGRYILQGVQTNLSPRELLGDEVEVKEYRVDSARDAVVVIKLEGGGLISYHRGDGSFLHTLNTPEGFTRKLSQLGINPL